jgi:hypothetical protein
MWNAGVVGAPIIWLPCYVGLRSWTPAAVDRRDHWVIQLPAGKGTVWIYGFWTGLNYVAAASDQTQAKTDEAAIAAQVEKNAAVSQRRVDQLS